jgi:CO/xanthine dehydrogenase Mo-binding subunit
MASVAALDPDGRLQVWTSTQSAFLARARLAAVLQMPASRIRVVQTTTGGGFGAKIVEDANNLIAAMLALATGRPVRLVNNRIEDFQAAATSLPERIRLRLGMDSNGLIVAKEVDILANCGAYCGLSSEVMHVSAMRSDNMHRLAHVRSRARLVYTHTPPHGAFRGFGGTQMLFALNSHIDTMARMLGLDTVQVHRSNAIGAGQTTVHGWRIGSTGLQQCLDQCTQALSWYSPRPKREGVLRPEHLLGLQSEMVAYTDAAGACERIRKSPIPFSYSVFLKKFIFIYVMTMPVSYSVTLDWLVIPVVVLVFYALASLELIAEEIENPFGTDPNDLPLESICETIRKSVTEILSDAGAGLPHARLLTND